MNLNLIKVFKKKNIKGFTLMEVIVALFIFAVSVIAIYVMTTFTIFSTIHASNKLTAAYLAQEGIELIRNIRDTNWLEPSHNPPDLHPWDEGLANDHCPGPCRCTGPAGCIVDYTYSTIAEPDLLSYSDQYLNIDNNGFYSYSTAFPFTPTKFKRQITISQSLQMLAVSVRVEWQERGANPYIEVRENLYNWR